MISIMGLLDTERVEELRKEKGLTQQEAAERARLPSKSYWNDMVKGRKANLTLEVLENVAKALGVDAKELLK